MFRTSLSPIFRSTKQQDFQLFHDSSRQHYGVTVTRCCSYSCFVLLKMGDIDARNMLSRRQINSVTCASCWDLYIRILLRCTDPWMLMSTFSLVCHCMLFLPVIVYFTSFDTLLHNTFLHTSRSSWLLCIIFIHFLPRRCHVIISCNLQALRTKFIILCSTIFFRRFFLYISWHFSYTCHTIFFYFQVLNVSNSLGIFVFSNIHYPLHPIWLFIFPLFLLHSEKYLFN